MNFSLVEISCPAQKYSWGKLGNHSLVGQLYSSNLNENETFAELWMGTHSSGPSRIKETNQLLTEYLKEKENMLGIKGYQNELPFLLKVLSVNSALSIQAHPNKELAKVLHEKDSKNYKDPNHKPELTCALTDFEGFCSFQKMSEISKNLDETPELKSLIGNEIVNKFQSKQDKESLKELFEAWMKADPKLVKEKLNDLIGRIKKDNLTSTRDKLVIRLYKDYPDDVGCFASYFLNYVLLKPGESLYLAPNEPHAYLYGDCIECMSCSDNVVRAGLTPKFRDTDVLVNMLTYDDDSLSRMKLKGIEYNKNITIYSPPIDEFMVAKVSLDHESTEITLPCANIFIVISGSGKVESEYENEKNFKELIKGKIFFNPKETKMKFTSDDKLLLFIASFNKF